MRVLVYCPYTGGHRHLYACQFCQALSQHSEAEVLFAHSGRIAPMSRVRHDSPCLEAMAQNPRIQTLLLEDLPYEEPRLEELVHLQIEHAVDVTLIIDGDTFLPHIAWQVLPGACRLRGRNYAIFIRSEFMYDPDATVCGFDASLLRLFYFYLLPHFSLLSGAFISDEKILQQVASPKYFHLPDVVKPTLPPMVTDADAVFNQRTIDAVDDFLARHPGKEVVLAYGDIERRKGLGFLLRLVYEDQRLVLLRIGRIKPGFSWTWEEVMWKEALIKEDRILQVDSYIDSDLVLKHLFDQIHFLALPYHQFYRTSAVMLDSVVHQCPVLVPRIGVIGERVLNYKLGMTYAHGDFGDFKKQYECMRHEYSSFGEHLKRYETTISSPRLLATAGAVLGHEAPSELQVGTSESQGAIPEPSCRIWVMLYLVLSHVRWRFRIWRKNWYVRYIWCLLGFPRKLFKPYRICCFGAGKHTEKMSRILPASGRMRIVGIADDQAEKNISHYWGMAARTPAAFNQKEFDAVLLSSDTLQDRMKLRCRDVFGTQIRMIDLYSTTQFVLQTSKVLVFVLLLLLLIWLH